MARAPDKEILTIPGPVGDLEALLESPGESPDDSAVANSGPQRLAVICHPHPQFQGTMHNKVVHTVARAMHDLGIPALRFNFRGVGASDGSYAEGEGEIDDLVAVVNYARQRWAGADIWLAGFSFGAVVAARAAAELEAARLVCIAPAVNILGQKLAVRPAMPWLIIQGDADDVVPPQEVIDWVAGLAESPQLIVLPGVGHFFHGHLVELRTILVTQLSD